MIQPLIDELIQIENDPLEVSILDGDCWIEKKFTVKLLCGICDAPARAKVLNTVQHNGYFGCSRCYIESSKSPTSKKLFYPIIKQESLITRTNSDWKRFVNRIENSENQSPIYGIKGTSPLLELTYIDMTIFCPPEFMHSQLLGTTKLFVDSWLGKIHGNIKLNG